MNSLNCPHCRTHLLEPTSYKHIEIDTCVHCGGLWFDKNELDKIIRSHEPDYQHDDSLVENLGQQIDVIQKQCPNCKRAM